MDMCKKISYLRLLLFTITFLFFSPTNILLAQWSTDPNNNLIVGYGLNPELCSDSAGGCYITYEVGYPSKIYLHRLDRYGYQPWGDKRIIAGELDEQSDAKIIEDGEGGVIVSYGDHILHERYKLRIQRVDSNGTFLWGPAGVKPSLTPAGSGSQKLVTDGDGGCVIVWIDTLDEYRINRIDRFGQRVWSDSGIYIQSDYNLSPPKLIRASDGNYYVQIRENLYRISKNGEIVLQDSTTLTIIAPDSEGGIVQSGRVWSGLISKLVAQRQDSLGNHLWQEPYVEIAESLYLNTQVRIQFNNDYYFYGWSGTKNGANRIAQFQALRSDGSKLYPEGSIAISDNAPLSVARIIPSEEGKTIFIWNNDPNLPDSTFTQMYDSLGNKNWDENGIVIAHPAFSNIGYTIDINGGFIIGGTINDFTIVAQQVSRYGNLGEIITSIVDDENKTIENKFTLDQNFPNPFNSISIIQYSTPTSGELQIELFNTLGEKVKTLVNKFHTKGMYVVKLSSDDLSSGIYLYRLKTEKKSLTKKLIIIK
jgi:hypothetical protein